MEYEWQQNVWNLGLGGLGITACSRLLADPTRVVCNVLYPSGVGNLIAYLPTDMSLPYFFAFVVGPDWTAHFPYGWPVVPNAPV